MNVDVWLTQLCSITRRLVANIPMQSVFVFCVVVFITQTLCCEGKLESSEFSLNQLISFQEPPVSCQLAPVVVMECA